MQLFRPIAAGDDVPSYAVTEHTRVKSIPKLHVLYTIDPSTLCDSLVGVAHAVGFTALLMARIAPLACGHATYE
jgi:hypothetical protein